MTRRLSICSAALLAMVALTGVPEPAAACIHAAMAASTAITQQGQRWLVVHDGAVQTTALRLEYEAGKPIADLALVIPVPSVPTRYATEDARLFDAIETWAPLQRDAPRTAGPLPRGLKAAAVEPPGIELLPAVKTGPYAIQPIKARGADGAVAVNKWLSDNGYAPIPEAALEHYVERDYAFATVRVVSEGEPLARSGPLPPLSFSFPSTSAIVPLKLEAQGVFPVRVYLVTRDAMGSEAFTDANAKGFETAATPESGYLQGEGAPAGVLRTTVERFEASDAPEAVRTLLASAGVDSGPLRLRVLMAERFGEGAADPSKWGEELAIPGLVAHTIAPGDTEEPEAKAPEAKAPEVKAPDKPPSKANTATVDKRRPKPLNKGGCGCGAGTPARGPFVLLVLLVLALRRRRD